MSNRSAAVLPRLQRFLEQFYDMTTHIAINDFVVDEETRATLPHAHVDLPEQLFVQDNGDEMALSLYISPDIINNLHDNPPEQHLHAGNLEHYCIALEGVSHFVNTIWRAQHKRPISLLELEIQAEIDKFIGAWLLLARQRRLNAKTAVSLSEALFARYTLQKGVPPEEHERYHIANQVAHNTCALLLRDFASHQSHERLQKAACLIHRHDFSKKMQLL